MVSNNQSTNAPTHQGTHSTPKSFRLHIGLFGRRNVGKSSLLNAMARQQVSIVSEYAGTTTDPVEKPMELLPLGPVLFIDTAGIDDLGKLGELRVDKTKKIFDRTDLGVIITEANIWGEYEQHILTELQRRDIPVIVILNKIDIEQPSSSVLNELEGICVVPMSTKLNEGILDFRQAILDTAPEYFFNNPVILRDIIAPKEIAIHVMPIDKEAPKGRLLLPQVQAVRDMLDGDAISIVVKESELQESLDALKEKPKLVVTDSSAFHLVDKIVPKDILLTSYSILFARFKGDLVSQVIDTLAIDQLKPGDKVLISEACSHHPIADDIGRVKIPRWINEYVGGDLDLHVVQGHDFPSDLETYKLVIHCGACMFNRREVLSRLLLCREAGVPCTNYGLLIAYCLGIFERVLEPFPAAMEAYQQNKK